MQTSNTIKTTVSLGNRRIFVDFDGDEITLEDMLFPLTGFSNYTSNNFTITKCKKYYKVVGYNERVNWNGTGVVGYGKVFIPTNVISKLLDEIRKLSAMNNEEDEPELLAKLNVLTEKIYEEYNKHGVQIKYI